MKEETNKLKRKWIWIWYNDTTRLLTMLGIPTLLLAFVCASLFGVGEYISGVCATHYVAMFGWMLIDNDYSNLRRIGMNEYREKING